MSMRLTVVGCAGSYNGPDSPASCYLLEAEHEGRPWRVVMDLGSGAFGALQAYVDVLAIDAVLFSHLHADHCLDLTGYYVVRRYHPSGHQPKIPVYGPPETARRMAKAYDLDEDPGMNEEFDFRAYGDAGGTVTVGPFTVEAVPVEHPVTAYGLRVSAGGRALGYSGDTGPCAGLDRVAAGVDLLLAEASFQAGADNPEKLHLTGREAGEAAARGNVGRLVVTHVPPWHDPQVALAEARETFGGEAVLAAPGQVYEL